MISATVAGYLGADPELAQAGQSQVLRFRVASTSKRGDKETTTWVAKPGAPTAAPAPVGEGKKGAGGG